MTLHPIASNMTELRIENTVILFSYKTPVACCIYPNMEYFKTDCRWSRTTSKHINKWLNSNTAIEKPQEYFDELVK